MIPSPEAPDAEFDKLLGSEIHSGSSRIVRKVAGHPDLVIKVSKASHRANWTEYLTYQALSANNDADLFGRIESVSQTGKYLIMEYLRDTSTEVLPDVPDWFTDRKRSAFGATSTGVIKIRDYGEIALGRVLDSKPRSPMPTHAESDEMGKWQDIMRNAGRSGS